MGEQNHDRPTEFAVPDVPPRPVTAIAPEVVVGESEPPLRRPRSRINLDTLFWAAILVWTGAVLLADNLGLLSWLSVEAFDLPWGPPFGGNAWALVFTGAGVLVALEVLIRLLVPAYRRNVLGYVILVIVFISLGLGLTELIWPLILIVLGAALLLRRRRR